MFEETIDQRTLRPTHIEVDLGILRRNYELVADFAKRPLLPVLKANAYGHGLIEVARLYQSLGAHALGVAYLEEALRLRAHGITSDILVLGGIATDQVPLYLEHNILLTASSVDKLTAIETAAAALKKKARVHLKIDTGMERIGVHWYSASNLLQASLNCPHVKVEGVFTHFANADEEDISFTRLQLERFGEAMSFYEKHSLPVPMRHAANSAALLRCPESHLDLVRPGLVLFGGRASEFVPEVLPVRLAMRWITRVVYFKVVQAGAGISYGSTYRPASTTRVVTLPVGYGDGYSRRLSGRGSVILRGKRYPLAGRVCMDQVMVDIGSDGTAFNGDEVILLGASRDGRDEITLDEMARWAESIPHEILVSMNTRIPRVYTKS